MNYRNAKKLKPGDLIKIPGEDKVLTVKEVILFGQIKKAKIFAVDFEGKEIIVYNEELA